MKEAQKDHISRIKKTLELRFGKRITWDELAKMAGIESRALKTYLMLEDSADYRQIPQLARQALERLLSQPKAASIDVSTLVSALSSLVISQGRIALVERSMISGLDAVQGVKGGLNPEERRVMAMLSRFCLQAGLPDHGGEIHDLLSHCKRPLQDWLRIPALIEQGLGQITLIDPEYGVPTPEAQDLAQVFSTLAARIEERIFDSLKESLKRYPAPSAAAYYTAIREFVVRNPVVSIEKLIDSRPSMPGALWLGVQQEFYEYIPSGLARNGKIHLCAHCSSLMQTHALSREMRCTSRACHRSRPALHGQILEAANARRVLRSIHQYWVEPGIDEIFLFDAMVKEGFAAQLYPYQDAVDISVGDIGMDLKTYASPEMLGAKFKKGIGGLSQYARKWIVIPEWLVQLTPNYLERLKNSMGDETASRMKCLSTAEALNEVIRQRSTLCGN